MVPFMFGSLESSIVSDLISAPTNIPTSPAGSVYTEGLLILKSTMYSSVVLFLKIVVMKASSPQSKPAQKGL